MKADPRSARPAERRRHRPPAPWAVLNLDVEALPEALEPPPGANAAMVVWRLRGQPLGDTWFAAGAPTPRAELRARAHASAGLGAARLLAAGVDGEEPAWTETGVAGSLPDPVDPTDPAVAAALAEALATRAARPVAASASIVICTRDRAVQLRDCLAAIADEIAAGRDVVVVDNGPGADTEAVVRAAGARYVVEPRAGLNRARNTGVAASRGEVVVFVDDDVRPEPGWADALARRFDEPSVAVVCGLVLPEALASEAQLRFQFDLGFGGMGYAPLRFDGEFLKGWRRAPPVWDIGAGANMAVRRSHVIAMGWFDERIGPGAAGGCGDDSELWNRALADGYAVRYEPTSVVRHQHRPDWAGLSKQAYGYAFGFTLAQIVQHARHGDPRNRREAYRHRPLFLLKRLLRAPDRWLRGKPDSTVLSTLRGYLDALRAARGVLRKPAYEPPEASRTERDVEAGLSAAGAA